ncbi:hypothetical protein K2X92_02540 [Candidatus Gracilibacteria bacterium]|nr:hypothetical protein [Candidatus Gracilibacteria bacterium]
MKVRFKHTALATVFAGISSVGVAQNVPSGWSLVQSVSTSNVKIYQKGTSKVYAQVVNIGAGAKVQLIQNYTGQVQSTSNFQYYRGYSSSTVANWYSSQGAPVSVVNGNYFGTNTNPSNRVYFSFGMRVNGASYDTGAETRPELINDLQLEIFTGQGGYIGPRSASRLQNGPAQNIIGGLSPNKAINQAGNIGRTGICTLSPSSPSGLILILSYERAQQSLVNTDFSAWQCNTGGRIMMDGSASSQLRTVNADIKIDGIDAKNVSGRSVPQVIVIRNN